MADPTRPIAGFDPWHDTPRASIVVLLLSVFFLFTTIGFANDILDMGRQPLLRFVLGVVLSGAFAVVYAIAGITLHGRFWKVFLPVFVVQVVGMGFLTQSLPDAPQVLPLDAAAVGRLHVRLIFDGLATMAAVSLGYTGFFYVLVKEARRYVKTRTEMALLESEMAAARQVQQVILPDPHQTFPGYAVDSVYKPAREVGGDFFQILSVGERGLLIVIGDVAGKGLPAAMLVSLLIGSIRATAEDTHDPVVMLRRLNERIVGRTTGGFATALAAFIADDGWVTIANAGHLSPYLDGCEVDTPGALPLGISGGGRYEVTRIELRAGSRLTFLSDGVVEAQNPEGKLFGFDRAKAISMETAAAIVDAAVQFGQADDITVVTIERRPRGSASDGNGSRRTMESV
ncbi:MAG: PP2C family protein-serine/threonine phosphatase [Terracidiphilus sp.]